MKTKSAAALGLLLVGAWLSPACGGDSESDDKKATGGAGGTGGSDAGSDVVSEPTPDVAPDVPKCKDSDCPGIGTIVNGCCMPNGECGYDGSLLNLGCVTQEQIQGLLEGGLDAQVPPDASDPNCDDYTVFGNIKLEGCCPSTGFCGVYEPLITKQCYDWGALPPQVPKPDNIVVKPCGPNADAAIDSGSDASSDSATDAGPG
ncbi:MAG: hypothetical protein U0263_03410 [Polyangiaceae bacterium]